MDGMAVDKPAETPATLQCKVLPETTGELLVEYGDTAAALCAYHDGHDTGMRWYGAEVLAAAEKWA